MSRTVIHSGTVLDPATRSRREGNVLIEDGVIFGIVEQTPAEWKKASQINASGKWVIPGLICLRSHVCEPGFEWKEDVSSASRAGAAGGFTTICATPDSDPINDVRAVTEQIVTRNSSARGARVLPVGAATLCQKGEHLSEMGDLRDAGCVAISTGEISLKSSRMMRRVLEYARSVSLPVFSVAQDWHLGNSAVMNEGSASLRLGMPSVPAEGESIALFRDGMLARLAGWPLHVQRISTAAAVNVLRHLRSEGVAITADVTPHHLWFDENHVASFDTKTRVQPPLRSQQDVEALQAAVSEGLISAIATDHSPQSTIEKKVEYRWSEPGTTGLETTLSVILELHRKGSFDLLDGLARLTCGPASILGRTDLGRLSEGAVADVVVVDPDTPKRVEATTMNSLSQNCIFDGVSLSGHVEATLVAGEIVHGTQESS